MLDIYGDEATVLVREDRGPSGGDLELVVELVVFEGNDDRAAHRYSPEQARSLARLLTRAADAIDGGDFDDYVARALAVLGEDAA